ncbi:MAG: nitrogenase [Firmicutes bacterium HGW-Firmicutes-8]|nr:MAG: nitrogenase [Firmicutes bacterium HGW-Firmicutes-8]
METLNCRSVIENPCTMCMPMGGILPFKGVAQSMVILHGSQGCATYMRRHIAEHFNEPIDVASSSLNEKGTVYGGEKNLKSGLDNLLKLYNPSLIGVLTTCLAETIGEDTDMITAQYLQERGLTDFPIVTVPTPGYGGSDFEGYWLAAKRIISALACKTKKHGKINVIIPNISPADIREIKRILLLMKTDFTLFPDFSDTLDSAFVRPYQKIPNGGTEKDDISAMPGAAATVQLSLTVTDTNSPGIYLEREFGIPLYNLPIPTGIGNTDLFINALKEITGAEIPPVLHQERGRLLDCMIDSHKYNFAGRSVIFGDPELVYAVTKTCIENGIFPVVVATGGKASNLKRLLQPHLVECPIETQILSETDFAQIRVKSMETGANIAIGHSDGRYLTEKEGIPLVRIGFPIHDRVGGQRLLSVGYTGTAIFLDRLTNTLLENKYKNYRRSMYEKHYQEKKAGERHGLQQFL